MDHSLIAAEPLPGIDSIPRRWSPAVRLGARIYDVGLWRKYFVVLAAASLCCTVTLKFADVQYLEWIFAVDFFLLTCGVLAYRLPLRLFKPYLALAASYGIFLAIAFLLSLFALDQDFTSYGSTLKSPVIVTVARMAELFLDVFYMLYLADLFRNDLKLCIFGAKTYLWTALAGCAYSALTFPLNFFYDAQLGTYSNAHRFRGFNNEGGGFGVYLVSAGVLAAFAYRQRWLSRRQFYVALAIFSISMGVSQSKSAFFCLAMLGVICGLWLFEGRRRLLMIGGLAIALLALGKLIDIDQQIAVYRADSERYRELSNLRWGDGNFVMGRIAGAVLAPRMIAARPILGIGWGNYALVRDDPQYRQGTAFSLGSVDGPSLGILDYIVELGIPLWLYLTWIELRPAFVLRQRRADIWLVGLALIQPTSNWSGAHLNLMHPWIIGAFALGLGFRNTQDLQAVSPVLSAQEVR